MRSWSSMTGASMGAHGWNGSLCWPRKQRMKSQWPLRPWRYCPSHILLSHWHLPSRGYRTPDSRPQATWPQDPSCRLKINHPLRDFPLVEYKKDPIRKKGHWFFSRASHPLYFPLINLLFLPDCPARSVFLRTHLAFMSLCTFSYTL